MDGARLARVPRRAARSYPDAGWPVLADMGLANFTRHELLHSFCGTATFIAPEVARHMGYGTAADWWGLGVLVCQMLTLQTPFEGPTQRATLHNIVTQRRTLDRPLAALLSPAAADFVDALLAPDPTERLGGPLRASELRVHPFFWGLEWSRLERRTMPTPHAAACRERALRMTRRMGFAPPHDAQPSLGASPAAPPAVPHVALPPAFALGGGDGPRPQPSAGDAAGPPAAAAPRVDAHALEVLLLGTAEEIEELPDNIDLADYV